MLVCMYVCMYACMHVCMYACTYVCTYVYMYVCMYVCVFVYTHARVVVSGAVRFAIQPKGLKYATHNGLCLGCGPGNCYFFSEPHYCCVIKALLLDCKMHSAVVSRLPKVLKRIISNPKRQAG